MPIIDQKDVSPDEAILLGHCPECGQALIPKTAVAHTRSQHWFNKDPNDPWLSEEARRRYKLIIDFAAARYNPALEERDFHRQGAVMAETTPTEDQKFWILQNRMLGVWAVAAGAVFATGLFALVERNYPAGALLTLAGAG